MLPNRVTLGSSPLRPGDKRNCFCFCYILLEALAGARSREKTRLKDAWPVKERQLLAERRLVLSCTLERAHVLRSGTSPCVCTAWRHFATGTTQNTHEIVSSSIIHESRKPGTQSKCQSKADDQLSLGEMNSFYSYSHWYGQTSQNSEPSDRGTLCQLHPQRLKGVK